MVVRDHALEVGLDERDRGREHERGRADPALTSAAVGASSKSRKQRAIEYCPRGHLVAAWSARDRCGTSIEEPGVDGGCADLANTPTEDQQTGGTSVPSFEGNTSCALEDAT